MNSYTMAHLKCFLLTWGVAILGLELMGLCYAIFSLNSSDLEAWFGFMLLFTWISSFASLFIVLLAWLLVALPYASLVLNWFPETPVWKHALAGAMFGFLGILLFGQFGLLLSPIAGVAGFVGAWKLAKNYQLIDQKGSVFLSK